MDPLALALEKLNLAPLFLLATFFGSVLSIYVMQVTSRHRVNAADPTWVQHSHRAIFVMIALTFVWMFSYAWDKAWQPWPPLLLLVLLYDALMVLRAFIIHHHHPLDQKVKARAVFPHRTN